MAWLFRTEIERCIIDISNELDIAKEKKYLKSSLDIHLACNSDTSFSFYYHRGNLNLIQSIREWSPNEQFYNSNFIKTAIQACILDDVNLSHVMNLLRIEELLEGYICELPISLSANILKAIIGELTMAYDDIEHQSQLIENSSSTLTFLRKLTKKLTNFIIECGRDRATYIKEAVVSPPITPPRMTEFNSDPLKWKREILIDENDLNKLSKEFHKDLDRETDNLIKQSESVYTQYKRADPILESLLLAGSLCSIRQRLLYLFSDENLHAKELIKWSLFRQLPRFNRARQLIFTRLLQMLATRAWRRHYQTAHDEYLYHSNSVNRIANYKIGKLFKFVTETFVQSGIRIWCYEDISQKMDIISTDNLPYNICEAIFAILCIQIPRSICELPVKDEVPDMETLAEMFSEWKIEPSMNGYEALKFTDMNMNQKDPYDLYMGFTHKKHRELTLGPRLHMGTPDVSVNAEIRFFANPLLTALQNPDKFEKTMKVFLEVDNSTSSTSLP